MANTGPVFPWDRLTSVDDYEVVDADLPNACDEAVAVWATTIGWPGRQEEMFRRHYLEYPDGQPELKFLRHVPTGQVVGTLGVGPRKVTWKGRGIRAGMLSHFCVVAAHRKMRPPMFLFKSVIDACRGRYDALYAMPGTQESAPHAIALQRMAVAGVTTHFKRRWVKVLRSAGYAARVLPRPLAGAAGVVVDAGLRLRDALRGGTGAVASRWADAVEPGMADLWKRTVHGDAWCASRDFAMLRWRFDRLPSHRRRHLLVEGPDGGPLLAWFACDDNHFDRGILVVQDYWLAGGSEAIDRVAIRALCRETSRLGYAAVEMRNAAPDPVAAAWIREGFVERGREPIPVFWLNQDVFGGTEGGVRITEFDNDG